MHFSALQPSRRNNEDRRTHIQLSIAPIGLCPPKYFFLFLHFPHLVLPVPMHELKGCAEKYMYILCMYENLQLITQIHSPLVAV